MNKKRFTTALVAALMAGVICIGVVGCKKEEPTETTTETTEQTTTTTTTAPTTTLTIYSGPMVNDTEVNWTETKFESPRTVYVNVSKGEFLNVRNGPGTTYDKVGTLTRGQSVVVVAKAKNIWYKTQDGFFVSDTYLTNKIPN
ncbi:MAG: SH3 domain-containing protein [Clostridiales bacterium]|nr:SH3 domain-containing protein [Clostridiales bacterium]